MIIEGQKYDELLGSDWDEQISGTTIFLHCGHVVLDLCKNLKDDEEYYQIDVYSTEEDMHLYDLNNFEDANIREKYVRDDIIYIDNEAHAYAVLTELMISKGRID